MKVNVLIFKDTGKYYTEESVEVDCAEDELYGLPDIVNEKFRGRYEGMHLVINAESDKAWPMMVPADLRK